MSTGRPPSALNRWIAAAWLCVWLISRGAPAQAADEFVLVKVDGPQQIRDISREYLGDPDVWPLILRSNGLSGVAELTPGRELRIPVSQLAASREALSRSLSEIQDANRAGAQLFAPDLIESAIGLRDEAVVKHAEGQWTDTLRLATRSLTSASSAREQSLQQRDQKAEARLSDRQGWVEGQKLEAVVWSERPINAILQEQEKLRTLSRSSAQVTFRDASRLRLNANSQAVIQKIRTDPLKRREEAQINLMEGSFYALLTGDASRNRLEVNVPNADASIDSGNFWVGQDAAGTKFTNYDDRPVRISAGGDTLTLGRNQGALVRPGEHAATKMDIKGAPLPLAPQDDATLFSHEVPLRWSAIEEANGYWIEIAFDPAFERLRENRWGARGEELADLKFAPGTYYWRVAALDRFGLPGARSAIARFHVKVDEAPPFLNIRTPGAREITREASVTVSGETEPGATVTVNGQAARTDAEGRFHATLQAGPGLNGVAIVARDEAGNETAVERDFIYMPDGQATIVYDPDLPRAAEKSFLTRAGTFSLRATATPDAQISIRGGDGTERASAHSDEAGRFNVNIPLGGEAETFTIRITARSGFSFEDRFAARTDAAPPAIAFERAPPRITASPGIAVAGTVSEAAELTVNGQPVRLSERLFEGLFQLEPGVNQLEFVATDLAGNVTVERRAVTLDQDAPALKRHALERKGSGAGQFLSLNVEAEDVSGLAKTARLEVASGGRSFAGVLRYNRATRSYQGGMNLPGLTDEAKLSVTVELEDDAGNKRTIELN